MEFLEVVRELQTKHKGKLVLIRGSIFYLEMGKDAIILNDLTKIELSRYKINEYRMKIRDRGKRKLKHKIKTFYCYILGKVIIRSQKYYVTTQRWVIKIKI